MTHAKVAYIDVDDTLLRSFGSKRIAISRTVEEVKRLHALGWTLYCWSSVGQTYAQQSAIELELEQYFTAFLPKPTLLIDDMPPEHWPALRLFHPNQLPATDV